MPGGGLDLAAGGLPVLRELGLMSVVADVRREVDVATEIDRFCWGIQNCIRNTVTRTNHTGA